MNERPPITKSGLEKVTQELEHLIRVEREELKVVLAEARALGDLRENAEYHAAKEKQSLLEGRIMHLQNIVAASTVVEVCTIKSEKVVFGATVTLIDQEGKKQKLQIVGAEESDSKKGKISYSSPLGRALIGKEIGDTVTVAAPKGAIEYEIEHFEFID